MKYKQTKCQQVITDNWIELLKLLEVPPQDANNDCIRCNFTFEQLVIINAKRMLEPQKSHNSAPSIDVILKLAHKFKNSISFKGYLINPRRDDCRISIDTIIIAKKHKNKFLKNSWVKESLIHVDEKDDYKINNVMVSRYYWD